MSDTIPSPVKKRSIKLGGHATSVSLEDPFWAALGEIGAEQGKSMQDLIQAVDEARNNINLSSAVRVFVLEFYRSRALLHRKRGRQSKANAVETSAAH